MIETNWDKLAEEYTQRGFVRREWLYGYKIVLDLLGDISGKKILDYGCGSGKFSRVLAKKGAKIIAVDPNEKMLILARAQNCQCIEYKKISDNDISFIDSIDYAVATYVLCDRKKDEEIIEIIRQIDRKLIDRGSFIVLEPHPNRQKAAIGEPMEIYLEGMENPIFDYWQPIEKYVSLLQTNGFTIDLDLVLESEDEQKKPQMLIIKAIK